MYLSIIEQIKRINWILTNTFNNHILRMSRKSIKSNKNSNITKYDQISENNNLIKENL